jgi:YegS/Rv2252/BmrU family lipid kinase
MRIHILGNEYAGSGKASQLMEEIKSLLKDYQVTSSFTEREPENFIHFIEENPDIKYLIVVGGDGTINLAIQAIVRKDIILIPVPAGTGSDLARTIGHVDLKSIPDIISSGNYRNIDLGLVHINDKSIYFINIMETGLGGNVMMKVNSTEHRTGLTFLTAILRNIVRLKPLSADIKICNEIIHEQIIDVIIANGQFYGKGIHASPDSIIDDGLLDVHIIKYMPRLRILLKLVSLRSGTYIHDKDVVNKKIKEISVTCNSTVEIDGETFIANQFSVDVCPGSLKIFGFPEKN